MLRDAVRDLQKSGISENDADNAEMYSVADASEIYPEFKNLPALVIPYIDPWTDDFTQFEKDGENYPFCRVRYYAQEVTVKSFAKKKLLRYSQPQGSGVHPYFPLVDEIPWQDICNDAETPLMITEGEKKALSACLAGIPTIGLGGVYNFTHDGELVPVLDRIEWSGRSVYICYDSDATDNSRIQAAEGRLATELSTKRNASVFLVRLPERRGGAKVGVDDFIVKNGSDALFDLLEQAPEMRQIDREVLRLNGEVAWIDREGMLLDLQTDVWMRKADFVKGSEFSSRILMVPTLKGTGVKSLSVAAAWLTHKHARRYTDTVFEPGTSDKAIELPRGGTAYNRFRGLSPSPGDVKPFFKLYDWLMSRTDEFEHDLIWKIIAYKMQNLAARIDLGLMLLGKQGSGKSLFGKIIAEMVEPYDTIMSSNELSSDFNGWIETSLIVVMNEAQSAKLKECMGRLHTYITEKRQPMNEKYRANRQVNNHAFFIFNSNERSAGAFSDDDRRMIILGCPDRHPDGDKFYEPIGQWYERGGSKHLLDFFLNYDLSGWAPPNKAPQTREKRMAYYASLTPLQKIADSMRSADTNLVMRWIVAAMDWAVSDQVGSNPYQISLASQIQQMMAHIQIRPFYTPEELALIFPSVAGTLAYGKVSAATPANSLAKELIQQGIDYLRCTDNYDGFLYNGQVRQYLIISDHHEYREPITQAKFDKLMHSFPTYREVRAQKRVASKRRKRRKNS